MGKVIIGILYSFLHFLLASPWAFSQVEGVVLNDIQIIDPTDGTIRAADVMITGDRIVKIGQPNSLVLEGVSYPGSGKYLLPGLIDAHIHLFQSGGLYTRPDAIDLRVHHSYTKERAWLLTEANDLLRRYLKCGVTSVIDVGGPLTNYEIRQQNQLSPNTSTLYATGPLISTYQPEAFKIDDPPIIKVHSAEESRQHVRDQLPFNPDFIKIWYIALPSQTAESTFDIVQAAIDESHQNNLLVAVHATQLNTAKLALKAGADILVHSVDDHIIDDDFVAMLNQNKAVYIPTLIVSSNYGKTFTQKLALTQEDFKYSHPIPIGSISDLKHLEDGRILSNLLERESQYADYQMTRDSIKKINLKILQENNCTIATGTDAGNIGTFHASSYFKEIRSMKECGLSNLDIIRASTIAGARVLKKEDEMGSVSEGKIADLIILNANPLADLEALQEIEVVIKGGKIIDPDTLVQIKPEHLVQQQFNGYNARNIEAFVAPYSDSVELYNFKEMEPWAQGKEQMRGIYANMFENTPDLHCQLVNRIIQGNTVIDRERVTGFKERDPIEATAIYEIENGKIARVFFVR